MNDDREKIYGTPELAEFFGVKEKTIWEWGKKGKLPAVNFGLSVTRVGNQTRSQIEREISDYIGVKLSEVRQAEELGKFGVELTETTMKVIDEGKKIDAVFQQDASLIIPSDLQILFAGLLIARFWEEASFAKINFEQKMLAIAYETGLLNKIRLKLAKITKLRELYDLINSQKASLTQIIAKVKKQDEDTNRG